MDPKQLMLMMMAQQQGNGAPPELSGLPMGGGMAGMQVNQPMQPPPPPVGFDSPTGILPPDSPAGHLAIPFFRDQAQVRADEQAKSRAQLRSQMMKPQFGGSAPPSAR